MASTNEYTVIATGTPNNAIGDLELIEKDGRFFFQEVYNVCSNCGFPDSYDTDAELHHAEHCKYFRCGKNCWISRTTEPIETTKKNAKKFVKRNT